MLRRLSEKDLTPAIVVAAKKALSELYPNDLGAEKQLEIEGEPYVARLERHYHPPGGPIRPWGPHKGISMFAVVDDASSPASAPALASASGPFVLGARSLARLVGVHPDLVNVVHRAIEVTPLDFTVVEGPRTKERQAELFKQGMTRTMQSRHLTGHAVDLAPWEGGQIHWDWPRFRKLAEAIKAAAAELKISVEWGGNWTSFPDGPHWQLPWKEYPA